MRTSTLLSTVTIVAVATLGLSACSSNSTPAGTESPAATDAPQDNTPNIDLPDGWIWAEGKDVPIVEAKPKLPVTVTDATGTEVTVKDASKIIASGDDVASILGGFGMADLVYAAPKNSDSLVGSEAPNTFEFSQQTGAEGLLSMDGTLFIGNNIQRHSDVAAQFRDAGVDAVVLDDQQSVPEKIRTMGSFLGVEDAADTMAKTVEDQLAEAGKIAADDNLAGTKVLQLTSNGAGGANAVVGSGTAGADIVAALGATSVGVEAGLRGYSVKYSDEGLLAAAPDVILVGTADLEDWGGLEGFLQAFPTLADTPAGKANNIIVMPSEQVKVSGPATGAGAVALAKALVELNG